MVLKHRGKETSRILNSPQSDKRFKTIYSTKYSRTEGEGGERASERARERERARAATNITNNESFWNPPLIINCVYPRERSFKLSVCENDDYPNVFPSFKDSLRTHDAEKFSKILFTLSRSGRCLLYRCKIHNVHTLRLVTHGCLRRNKHTVSRF